MEDRHFFDANFFSGYTHGMGDYHFHNHYEISLVTKGRIHVLLRDFAQYGDQPRLILSPPKAPHRIFTEPSTLYERTNISFSEGFLSDFFPRHRFLLSVFRKNGRVILLNDAQAAEYQKYADAISGEHDPLRRKLHILLYLSKISEQLSLTSQTAASLPACVGGALNWLHEHYAEKITAGELAWKLGVGRTTLMTLFKKHTGSTLNEFVTQRRLQAAIELMGGGATQQEAAEKSGFGDCCNMIRCFKRSFGLTPRQYMTDRSRLLP